MRILLVISVLFLIGCTPQKRLNQLLSRHPYLAKDIDSTFYDTTRVITKDIKVDTIHTLESLRHDTLIVTKDRLTVKTFVYKDSIYVYGNCESDTVTVIKEITVPVKQFVYQPKSILDHIRTYGMLILVIIGIIFGIRWILRTFIKK